MENCFFIHFSPIFQDFFIVYTSVTYQNFWGWLGGVLFAGLGGVLSNLGGGRGLYKSLVYKVSDQRKLLLPILEKKYIIITKELYSEN